MAYVCIYTCSDHSLRSMELRHTQCHFSHSGDAQPGPGYHKCEADQEMIKWN